MTVQVSEICSNCKTDTKCRRRDFSEQAWTVLVLWKEVQSAAVDQPICEDCYNELREVLIDRADEVEVAVTDPTPKKPVRGGTPQRQKVRRAG